MQSSKDYLKNNNIRPKISFKGGEAKTLVLMKDRLETIKDQSGKEISGVKYLVRENGEEKTFFSASIGLIQKLSEFNEGDEVTIQMKSRKGESGGFVSYYEVTSNKELPSLSSEETPMEDIVAEDDLGF